MWSSRLLLIVVGLVLSGCGFHPMYGQRADSVAGAAGPELAAIRIAAIADRKGQILRNALLERLNPRGEPDKPRYVLTVTVSESMTGLGVQRNNTASLGEMTVSATYQLRTFLTAAPVASGSATSVVSVDYLGARYGSVAIERDAEDRVLIDIADDLRNQLAARLKNPAVTPETDEFGQPTGRAGTPAP